MANFAVSDLQVEEEEVGTIIERIMAEGAGEELADEVSKAREEE